MAFLRVTWGILIASYMDDILIQGSSPSQVCLHAFFPKQQTTLLGFILVSVSMTVSCPLGRITWENFDGHLHGWYSHQGVLLSTGAFICTWGYFTVLGSGLVPNLEEGCFFPKSTGYPSWLLPILALFWTLSLWLLLALQMGLPDCSLCAGVWRTLSLCMVLSVFLAQWSMCVQCHLLYAALQCFSEVTPGSISLC